MINPFKASLSDGLTSNAQVAILPTGNIDMSDDGFRFPAPQFEWEAWNAGYTTSPGGYLDDVAAAKDPTWVPDYAGKSGVHRIDWESGITPQSDYSSVIAAPGSVDMSQPRDYGSVPGRNNTLLVSGPVEGNGNVFSGYIAKLRSAQPGVIGPVSGGQDYANQVAQTNNAAYAQLLSQAAAASALVSAV
jgi:hypothetical protein